jgi:alpha-aminoadipate carrier protein LysW
MPITAECPDCAATVPLAEDVMAGEIVSCPECGRELETVSGEKWTLVPAPEEEEDWGE